MLRCSLRPTPLQTAQQSKAKPQWVRCALNDAQAEMRTSKMTADKMNRVKEIQSLFDASLRAHKESSSKALAKGKAGSSVEGATAEWAVADLEETPYAYHLYVDAPGIRSEDVQIFVHPDKRVITISWERVRAGQETPVLRTKYERKMGVFKRNVTLASNCDASTVRASLKNGVLHLSADKLQPAESIPVF